MRVEDWFREATGFKQSEAQQDCVAHRAPDRAADVLVGSNWLDEHGIDRDTDNNEKSLEAECQQRTQVVLADTAPLAVGERCHRDWSDRCNEIDLNHAAIDDQEDTDGKDIHR